MDDLVQQARAQGKMMLNDTGIIDAQTKLEMEQNRKIKLSRHSIF